MTKTTEDLETLVLEDRKARGEAGQKAIAEVLEKYKIELVPVVIIKGDKVQATIEMVVN